MRNLKKKKKVFHAAPLSARCGAWFGTRRGDPERREFQHSKGRTAPRAAGSGLGSRTPGWGLPGARCVSWGPSPRPEERPLPPPVGWGGLQHRREGQRQAFLHPHPPPPEPLKHREGQGRLGSRWRGGEGPRPALCLLTRVRFLPCSGRDGGEKTAVTRARAAPCTPSSPQRSLPPSPAAAGLAVQ